MLDFAPKLRRCRSVDLWRREPVRVRGLGVLRVDEVVEEETAERRCESRSRRCSARSFLRCTVSVGPSVGFALEFGRVDIEVGLGGLEDCG